MTTTYLQTMAILWAMVPFHIMGDWMFQNYTTAMNKSSNWKIRFLHVVFYTLFMYWGFNFCGFQLNIWEVLAIGVPHFIIDSYKPVYWWVKLFHGSPDAENTKVFKEAFEKPRHFVVCIVLDQAFHMLSLIPLITWLLMK